MASEDTLFINPAPGGYLNTRLSDARVLVDGDTEPKRLGTALAEGGGGAVTEIIAGAGIEVDQGTGAVTVSATVGAGNAIRGTTPTTDVAPGFALAQGGNASPQATGANQDGAPLYLFGGIGSRFFTVVDFSVLSGVSFTITINGTGTTYTEGVEWTAATSNNATATSIAAAIGGIAAAVGANVYITPAATTRTLTISSGDNNLLPTSGTNGIAGGGPFAPTLITNVPGGDLLFTTTPTAPGSPAPSMQFNPASGADTANADVGEGGNVVFTISSGGTCNSGNGNGGSAGDIYFNGSLGGNGSGTGNGGDGTDINFSTQNGGTGVVGGRGGDIFIDISGAAGGGGGARNGQYRILGLPTSDPAVADAVYSENGFLVRSGTVAQISQNRVTTAQFDKTNDTTLADIPALEVDVAAAGTYIFEATLFTISNIGTGVKAAIGGTCTATSIIYEGTTYSAGVSVASAATRTTTKGNAVGGVTAVTVARIDITGTIVVNAAGTLTVQFAENAGIAATTSSVLINSKFVVTRVS